MELESLKRQVGFLEKNDVTINKMVTDRHNQVTAYLAEEKPHIEHAYDVWHIAKGKDFFICNMEGTIFVSYSFRSYNYNEIDINGSFFL